MDSAVGQRSDAETALAPDAELTAAVARAREALLARQHADGYWCYELEGDSTIPAEYTMMMHSIDEIDAELEAKFAAYLRAHQQAEGGWPLYTGGDFDMSCSVKAYYALKLAGDDPDAPHMARAREAILAAGGAARANVLTRAMLALAGEMPWRGVPFIPVEIMLLPWWFPFHVNKISYWSRTVMVPLSILCTLKPRFKNPRNVHVSELFVTPPEEEKHYFPARSTLNRAFTMLDSLGRRLDPLIPGRLRERALKKAEDWIVARLNGESGLGAIFPAMMYAYEALLLRGYASDHPYCVQARRALRKLVMECEDGSAYCQPCVSPVWDTGLAALALQTDASAETAEPLARALDWLAARQVVDEPGDWRVRRPHLKGGSWAFQFANPYYPDLDDTAVVAWALHQAKQPGRYGMAIRRAADWLHGMQSENGGFAAFETDNTYYYLNEIPFGDSNALLDPPTSDVSARVLALLSRLGRPGDRETRERCLAFLRREQESDGAWFGRWGTNYIYGTWSVLMALEQAGESPEQPWIQRAVAWLKRVQRIDGGWGESNDTYFAPGRRGQAPAATSFHTAWALLGLMAAGEAHSEAVRRGVDYLVHTQNADGGWVDAEYTAPGFPRVFYLKYHGYSAYFPFWALARYQHTPTCTCRVH